MASLSIYWKLNSNQIPKATGEINIQGTAAGRGFFTIDLSDSVDGSKVISVVISAIQVANTAGIQLTPIAVSGTKLYVNYYAHNNISADCVVTFKVYCRS